MPSYTMYTVKNGDTLYSLAKQCDTTPETLMRINGLSNGARLSVGQQLRMPCPPASRPPASRPPASRPPASRPPRPIPRPPQEIIYIVQPGDTLGDIAFRFGTTVPVLLRLNDLDETETIYPGQELRIPDILPEGNNVYVVQAGDTLWSIAKARGTTVEELVRLNNIRTPNLIFPGDRLRLP